MMDLIKNIWGYYVSGNIIYVPDDVKERFISKKNVENYCILDQNTTPKTIDLKLNVKKTEINFKNVHICNDRKTMTNCAGTYWNLAYHTLPNKNQKQLDGNYFKLMKDAEILPNAIILSVNDNPIHMGHITAEFYDNMMYISLVYVHPDFQGKGLVEKMFLILWSYLKHANYVKDLTEVLLIYSANVPVFQTYNRMINLLGFHSPVLDSLNLEKNRYNKDILQSIHTILLHDYSVPAKYIVLKEYFFTFNKKLSSDYEKNKLATLDVSKKLKKLIKKLRGEKIKSFPDAYLFWDLYAGGDKIIPSELLKWNEKMMGRDDLNKLLKDFISRSTEFVNISLL